jgi:hypothetical protein
MFDSATLGGVEVRQEVSGLSHGSATGLGLSKEVYSSQGYRIFAEDSRGEARSHKSFDVFFVEVRSQLGLFLG